MRQPPPAPDRSSVLVLVLVTLVFTAAALTAFVERAGNDLMVEVHRSDSKRLRQEAFSALEVTLAVLEDFREADNGLHSTAEGWGDPLTWAGWSPSEGRTVDISFRDESGKIPLAHADLTTLTNMFEAWQLAPADAEKLADRIMSDRDVALDTLAREELGLDPDDLGSPWGAALSSLFAFAIGAFVVVSPRRSKLPANCACTE